MGLVIGGPGQVRVFAEDHGGRTSITFKDVNGDGALGAGDTATYSTDGGDTERTVSINDALKYASGDMFFGNTPAQKQSAITALRALVTGAFLASRGKDPTPVLKQAYAAGKAAGSYTIAGDCNQAYFEVHRVHAAAASKQGDLSAFDTAYRAFRQEFKIGTAEDRGNFNDFDEVMGRLRSECRFNLLMNQATEKARAGAAWGDVLKIISQARDMATKIDRDDLIERTRMNSKSGPGTITHIRTIWAAAQQRGTKPTAVGQ